MAAPAARKRRRDRWGQRSPQSSWKFSQSMKTVKDLEIAGLSHFEILRRASPTQDDALFRASPHEGHRSEVRLEDSISARARITSCPSISRRSIRWMTSATYT